MKKQKKSILKSHLCIAATGVEDSLIPGEKNIIDTSAATGICMILCTCSTDTVSMDLSVVIKRTNIDKYCCHDKYLSRDILVVEPGFGNILTVAGQRALQVQF